MKKIILITGSCLLVAGLAIGLALLTSASDRPGASSPDNSAEAVAPAVADFKPDTDAYRELVRPFLDQHCLKCHGPETQKSGFRVDTHLPNEFLSRSVTEKWNEVLHMLNAGDMPPEDETRPETAEVRRVVEWIEGERLRAERARRDRAVVLRRLNREEYNNTIRDLIGIDFELADDFPEEPPVGGFENNGRALTISPMHLELYLKTARRILDQAIVTPDEQRQTIKWRFRVENGRPGSPGRRVRLDDNLNRNIRLEAGNRPPKNGMMQLRWWAEGVWVSYFHVPRPGRYLIRVKAAGVTPPEEAVRKAGPMFHVRRQEERERKISNPAERRRSRENFNKFTLGSVTRHFNEDRRYRVGPPRLKIRGHFGGRIPVLAAFDVDAPLERPRVYEIETTLTPAKSRLHFSNDYRIPGHWYLGHNDQHDDFPRPELFIDWVEIEGPIHDAWPPASHTRILFASPNRDRNEEAYVREALSRFMRRAYRRPLREGEVEPMMAVFRAVRPAASSFEEAIKTPLTAVLASPDFLYLVEDGDSDALNDFQLAARLSYFLWSSLPDEELDDLALSGRLRDPATLRAQADRLLEEPRSRAFVKNFAGQWLGLRQVGANPPSSEIYSRYDEHLETSMRGETEAFFEWVLREDHSVLSFLKSDHAIINERLARFYDIRGVKGDRFRPVPVPGGVRRGGLLTQASILSITSNGTRTSPVWRGAWILENLLGDPPPPPPPNAGDIPPVGANQKRLTVRQRLQAHRAEPQCARCHDKIDPLGFALENFAASGEWRDGEQKLYGISPPDRRAPAIDARAKLPDGTEFTGVEGLQRELLKRQDAFLRCLADKLYTYALGRELGYADKPVLDDAVRHLKGNKLTLRSLIHHIVSSELFRTK